MNFEPSRSSTPPRTRPASQHPSNTTITSTTSSTLPLSALTDEHIEVLDDIISRAPTASTFLAVFNAYKEVLRERGIEEEEDVIYYGFLLKLGVVKAKDWQTRWKSVKDDIQGKGNRSGIHDLWASTATHDHSYDPETEEENPRHLLDTPRPPVRPSVGKRSSLPVHNIRASAVRQATTTNFDTPGASTSRAKPPRQVAPLPPRLPSPSSESEVSYIEPKRRVWAESDDESEPDGDVYDQTAGSKAPSYQTFATSVPASSLEPHPKPVVKSRPSPLSQPSVSAQRSPPKRQLPTISKEERGVNGHDFWEVEQMERDADDFREEMLVRRCWGIWRMGLDWITVCLRCHHSFPIAQGILVDHISPSLYSAGSDHAPFFSAEMEGQRAIS